jgi:hypothetical protein
MQRFIENYFVPTVVEYDHHVVWPDMLWLKSSSEINTNPWKYWVHNIKHNI